MCLCVPSINIDTFTLVYKIFKGKTKEKAHKDNCLWTYYLPFVLTVMEGPDGWKFPEKSRIDNTTTITDDSVNVSASSSNTGTPVKKKVVKRKKAGRKKKVGKKK